MFLFSTRFQQRFWGKQSKTIEEELVSVSEEECWLMERSKKCEKEEMSFEGYKCLSFKPPSDENRWMVGVSS
jgi:hypothetical protein